MQGEHTFCANETLRHQVHGNVQNSMGDEHVLKSKSRSQHTDELGGRTPKDPQGDSSRLSSRCLKAGPSCHSGLLCLTRTSEPAPSLQAWPGDNSSCFWLSGTVAGAPSEPRSIGSLHVGVPRGLPGTQAPLCPASAQSSSPPSPVEEAPTGPPRTPRPCPKTPRTARSPPVLHLPTGTGQVLFSARASRGPSSAPHEPPAA